MPYEDAAGAAFVKKLGERYKRPADTIESVHYPSGMLAAAIAIEAIKRAHEAGKPVTGDAGREAVYAEMLKLSFDPGLAVGPVTYTKEDHVGVDHMRVLRAEGGKFVPITEPFQSKLFRKVHYGK